MDWRRFFRFKIMLIQFVPLVVYFSAFLCIVAYNLYFHFDRLLVVQNNRLLLAFALYVITILVFSFTYYRLYRSERDNFHFSGGIAGPQGKRLVHRADKLVPAFTEIEKILASIQPKLELAANQKVRLDAIRSIPGDANLVLRRSDRRDSLELSNGYSVHFERRGGGYRSAPTVHAFITKAGELVGEEFDLQYHYVTTTRDLFEGVCEIKLRCEEGLADLQARLGTLSSATPDLWTYRDFLYFSTVTQTTVGYGDILPNSSIVRTFVMLQILIGYLIIAVFINMTFAR